MQKKHAEEKSENRDSLKKKKILSSIWDITRQRITLGLSYLGNGWNIFSQTHKPPPLPN